MTIVTIAIYVVLVMVGLGLLTMLLFGIRSLAYGKINPLNIGIVLTPIILLLVLGFVMGDWAIAAIYTVMIMFALAVLALLVTGIRGIFN